MTVPRIVAAALVLLATGASPGCNRHTDKAPLSIRLVDAFEARRVTGSRPPKAPPVRRTEWRFDGPPPSPAAPPPGPAGGPPVPPPAALAATRGWEAGPGVEGLAVKEGRLTGRSTTAFPV